MSRFLYIVNKDYTFVKPYNYIFSITRTGAGLFEIIVAEPLYRNTIHDLLFHSGSEAPVQGDKGKPGLERDIEIPGVKGDKGKPGLDGNSIQRNH